MSLFARWVFRFALAGLLAGALGYLPYRTTDKVGRVRRLQRQLGELGAGNLELERHNRLLRRQIRRLKHDPRAIERVARDELGLVRADDVVFQFEP